MRFAAIIDLKDSPSLNTQLTCELPVFSPGLLRYEMAEGDC